MWLLTTLGGQHPSVGTTDCCIPEALFIRLFFKVGCRFCKIQKCREKRNPQLTQIRKAIKFQIPSIYKAKPHKLKAV